MENKQCSNYCGVDCVNGLCPITNNVCKSCSGCIYYKGCEDCAFNDTDMCTHEVYNAKVYTCRFYINKFDDMIVELDVIANYRYDAISTARFIISKRLETHPDRLHLVSIEEH